MHIVDSLLLISLPVWNVAVCMMYAADKQRAQRKQWRYRERTLILCALCMGGVGAFIGMRAARHKTRHTSFNIAIPFGVLLQIVCIALYVYIRLRNPT